MTVASGVLAWLLMNHQISKTWETLRDSSSSFNRSCDVLFSNSCRQMSVWSLKQVDSPLNYRLKMVLSCMHDEKKRQQRLICQYCLIMWVYLHKIRFQDQNYWCHCTSKILTWFWKHQGHLPCVLPSLRSFFFVSLWFLKASNSLSKGSISCKKTEQRNVKLF